MNKLRAVLACIVLSIAAYGQSGSGSRGSSTTPTAVCGDVTHALGWTGTAYSCQAISGSAAAGGNASTLQWNNAAALGGIVQYTTNGTTTITGGATAVFDMSAAGPTTGLKIPTAAAAAPLVDGFSAFNTTTHLPVWGFNGASTVTVPLTKAALGSNWLTSYNQATGVFGQTQPAFSDITGTLDLTSATFGSRGTITTLLHGNAGGVLSFGSVVNADVTSIDAATKLTGLVPIANGGTNTLSVLTGLVRGGAAYTAAELSGDATTSGSNVVTVVKVNGNSVPSGAAAHQTIVATGASAFALKTINDCTGGASALSFAQSGDTFGCVTGILNGALTPARVPFASGATTLTDSANFTYAAASGLSMTQGANNADLFYAKRFTDTAPTGNFLHFQNNAAASDLFKVDASGALTAVSLATSSAAGVAGSLSLIQGTACVSVPNAWNFCAPGSVTTATLTMPAALTAGFWRTTSGGTVSFSELSGDATTSNSAVVTVVKVNGTAYASGPSNDTVPVITAANTATYTGITNCGDATHALAYSTGSHTFSCQAITGAAAAGGSNTQVQFNSTGAIAGSANLVWVSPALTVGLAGVTGQYCIAGLTSGSTCIQATATASGTITVPAVTTTLIGSSNSSTTVTQVLHASATGFIGTFSAIAQGDLPVTSAQTIASGTSAMGTSAISSATCDTVVTTSATGTATTDVIWWGFNSDPTGVTGYVPATSGMLTIIAYPSANNVNFKVCNNTSSSITPGARTLNWRVVR